jgi:MFS transporter, YNFM family, putative membrane transport protein
MGATADRQRSGQAARVGGGLPGDDPTLGANASPPSLRPIALLSAAAFCNSSCLRITDPMLPMLAQDFRVTTGAASAVVTAFALAYGVSQLAYGPIGDRCGKYRVICVAMTLSAVAIAVGAAARSLPQLAMLRLLAGVTTAGVLALALAYVGDVVPYAGRQAVLARVLSGQLLGVICGQAAGGILIGVVGWRVVFLLLGAVFAGVSLLLWRELLSGRVVQPGGAEQLRAGQLRAGRMVRDYLNLLTGAHSRRVLIAISLEGLLFFGMLAYFAAFLRQRFALDYLTIGPLLGCFGLGGLGYGMFARWIVPALGERRMMVLGGVLLLCGLLLLGRTPVWAADAPVMAVLGFALYMVHNTLQTNATQMAPDARGAAVSLFTAVFFCGQAIGAAATGAAVARFGYSAVFAATGLCLLALCGWFARCAYGDAAAWAMAPQSGSTKSDGGNA